MAHFSPRYCTICLCVLQVILTVAVKKTSSSNSLTFLNVCSTELTEERYRLMMQNGNCSPYKGTINDRATPCDNVFEVGVDYVYVPNRRLDGDQQEIRDFIEDIVPSLQFIQFQFPECLAVLSRALCVHYYLPCGFNNTRHVPRFLCPDVCQYLTDDVCRAVWPLAMEQLRVNAPPGFRNSGVNLPECNNPSKIISFLSLSDDCCSNAGIVIPQTSSVTDTMVATAWPMSSVSSLPMSSVSSSITPQNDTTVISIATPIGVVILILLAICASLIIAFLCWRKSRRKNIRLFSKNRTNGQPTYVMSAGDKILESQPLSEQYHQVLSVYTKHLADFVIPSSRIKLMETLGQGEFGVVYRGLLFPEIQSDAVQPESVAVKTLKGQMSSHAVTSIMEESLKMKFFDHVNVLKLLGVCINYDSSPCIIMPFMSHGSLLSYLTKERHKLVVAEGGGDDLVSSAQKKLLSMCLQVAKGMAYLASQRFVHRDLAARNCMVSSSGVIKVADFGLTEDMYQNDYYRQISGGIKLPIKWMALESIHNRHFSEKSDVWAFGVTCWEVFNLGRLPYPTMSPEEVVDFLDGGSRLKQPNNAACSDTIYEVMLSCWENIPDKRPTFDKLVDTLSAILKPLANYMDFIDSYYSTIDSTD